MFRAINTVEPGARLLKYTTTTSATYCKTITCSLFLFLMAEQKRRRDCVDHLLLTYQVRLYLSLNVVEYQRAAPSHK